MCENIGCAQGVLGAKETTESEYMLTAIERRLIDAGNVLARSIGHRLNFNCPKISPAVPCTCGAGAQQAQALADWSHLVQAVKES